MLLFCYMRLVNIEELGGYMRNSNLFSQFFISAIWYSSADTGSDVHSVNKAASMLRSILGY